MNFSSASSILTSVFLLYFILGCSSGNEGFIEDFSEDKWLVNTAYVEDGGVGKDGIPALPSPAFVPLHEASYFETADARRVVGFKDGDTVLAFSHAVMNYHEIASLPINDKDYIYNYCPLTGTAMMWGVPENFSNKTFGTSGLLYNSNLILYDRETNSKWSQMLTQSINGELIREFPSTFTVVETSWETWSQMYPNSLVLSDNTGWSRDYTLYQYGNYETEEDLLTSVENEDVRLHRKTRVLGVKGNGLNKVYVISAFNSGIHVINEDGNIGNYVVVGSSDLNFAMAYSSVLTDGTILTFSPSTVGLPVVLEDQEGGLWDIFGQAVSGPRTGEMLERVSEYNAYWFAWVAFFPNPEIHSF